MESVPENQVVGGDPTATQSENVSLQQKEQQQQVSLMEIEVKSETDALNLMAGFLQVAQRRGAYTLAEAGKIMEAINKFGKAPTQQQ
tara:strand:+ start:186 stop:446 length:261 start_codon:yes stop_codon:yes gene_type:complete